ncbi:hypothetical protein E2C01_059859 [Portunus trituberculatus]|uniref:Uncharacterized protein n=1 Tax=Portunus trituberculatus TaxID=210409 RepID=A0A5B7H6I6_PORTR|nr:hypothetical protein [Portunus trituberculatus]
MFCSYKSHPRVASGCAKGEDLRCSLNCVPFTSAFHSVTSTIFNTLRWKWSVLKDGYTILVVV